MTKIRLGIFLVYSLLFTANAIGSDIKEPMVYYKEAKKLMEETDKAISAGDFRRALIKSKNGLEKLGFIKSKFPEWKNISIYVVPLEEEFRKTIKSTRANLKIQDGRNYELQGNYKKAMEEYGAVLNEYPDQIQPGAIAQLAIGNLYMQQGEYEQAIQAYKTVLEKYKDQPRMTTAAALISMGRTYTRMGKYEDARKAYNTVLSEYKDLTDSCIVAQYGIGEIYQWQGEKDKATQIWEKIVKENSGNPYANVIRMQLELIPVLSPEMLSKYNDRQPIIARFIIGQLSDEQFVDRFVKLNKEYKNETLFWIGFKYQMQGNLDKARECYQRYIDISKNKEGQDFIYNLGKKALEGIKNK